MWISLMFMIISGGMVLFMLRDKRRALQAGVLNDNGQDIYPYVEPYIRKAVKTADNILVHLSRGLAQFLLTILKRFTPWFHKTTQIIEKRLLNIIAVIKGRGILRERGAASVFLSDLMHHKERIGKGRPTF